MAAEFQTHVDEMVREADLSEVRTSINEIRNFDFRGEIEKTIDADGSIRSTFASDPLAPTPAPTSVEEIAVSEPVIDATRAGGGAGGGRRSRAVPHGAGLRAAEPGARRRSAADTGEPEPPAFIPPDVVQQRRAHPSA